MAELTTSQRWNFRLLAHTGSVLKALNILHRPAASAEIAVILGISPPTARRRLADLEAMGFVARLPESGCYAACADFDALLGGDPEPEAAAESIQPEAEQSAEQAAVVGPDAAPPAPDAREDQPAQGLPVMVEDQSFPPPVEKKFFPPPPPVVNAVKYLINLIRGLTTTTAPPGGKIFSLARLPAAGGLRLAPALGPPRAHAPPGPGTG